MEMRSPSYPRQMAFSLIELVIAVAVLTMLTLFVAQLVNNASIIVTNSRKHTDAASQARLVFDRMSGDFAKIVRRTDVDYLFSKQPGNDKMFFYSEAPAFFDGGASTFKPRSSVALVGYRINANYQIERFGKLLSWSGGGSTQPGGVVFLTYPPTSKVTPKPTPLPSSLLENNWTSALGSAPAYDGVDDDYHVIADQVCRLEFCFQLNNGKYVFDPVGGAESTVHSLDDVSAVVVALVVLDAASQKIVDISKVSAAFSDPTTADLSSSPPVLMAEHWQKQLYQSNFAQSAGIPREAAAQIRIFERHFRLNTP